MSIATLIGPIEGVAIVGAGTAFPARVLDNVGALRAVAPWALGERGADEERLAFLAQGLEETLGVRERAWAHVPGTPFDHANEETSATLAVQAAKEALRDAGLEAGDVPLVVCATATPPRMTSSIAAFVGASLGLRASCIDVRTGCSGGLVALATAAMYVAAGVPRALVIGAETFSKILPKANKVAAVSMGDGAGAIVIARGVGRIAGVAMETDGKLGGLATTDGALPPTHAEIDRGGYELSGSPEELAAVIPGKYAHAIAAVRAHAPGEIDAFVPHQTSRPLIEAVATAAKIPVARAFVNVPRHANIGSAGLLTALAEARAEGRVKGRVLLAVVGGGMTWASAVLET